MLKINLKINKNKGIFADGACEYMKHLREELRNFGYDVSTGFGSEGGYLNYYLFAKINDKDTEVLYLRETSQRATIYAFDETKAPDILNFAVEYLKSLYAFEVKEAQ